MWKDPWRFSNRIFEDMDREFAEAEDMLNRMFRTDLEMESFDLRSFPYYYGCQVTIGPDGRPKVREFGNIRPSIKTGLRTPIVDTAIDEKENTLTIIAEMSGITKQDVKVNITDQYVSVRAEKGDKKYHVDIPVDVHLDDASAKATYSNGILELKNYGNNNNDNNITLGVAETNSKFVGRSIALIDPKVMEDLGLSTGNIIEIPSRKRNGFILPWSGQPADYGKGLIRVDGYSRNNIGVGIDDKVTIRKVNVKKAEQVILSPTEGLNILGLEDYLLKLLEDRIVAKGDTILLNRMGRKIGFVITGTTPSDAATLIDSRQTEFIIGSVPRNGTTTRVTPSRIMNNPGLV
jgi:HSP20 family protein